MTNSLGNKKIFAENLQRYMDTKGIDRNGLSDAINVPYTTVTDWLKGKTYPRIDKIELMARYFGISKSDLIEDHSEQSEYYNDADVAELAQAMFDRPELRVLFDASKKATKEDIEQVAELLERLSK